MQLELNTTGDLLIENDKMILIDGVSEIQQLVSSKLKTFMGEYFLDNTIGLPYFQVIFEKGVNPSIIYSIFLEALTNIDGIEEITQLDIDVDYQYRTGTIDIECKADSEFIKFTLPIGVQ